MGRMLEIMEKILVLGASGTIGTSIYQHLSQYIEFDVYGTFFSSRIEDSHIHYFSLENIERIAYLLKEIAPDIVISTMRGDYKKQLDMHNFVAKYLMNNHGRLLYFSTVNVFDGDLECPHYEDDSVQSVSEYGRFKICCETQLKKIMGNRAVILRIPFLYGKNSPRMTRIKKEYKSNSLDICANLICNYVTDVQVARYVEWIIREKKEGIFHVGTIDLIQEKDFIKILMERLNIEHLALNYVEIAGTMAVLSKRKDVPYRLTWDVQKVVNYLCNEEE